MALDKDYANAYKWVHANPAPFQNLIARITAAFPEYVEEIKGTAKGTLCKVQSGRVEVTVGEGENVLEGLEMR